MEALLGYEMVQVACGASHVLALSTERELFAWGRGHGGKASFQHALSLLYPPPHPFPFSALKLIHPTAF